MPNAPTGVLAKSHLAIFGTTPQETASTATTDARLLGLYGDMSALVYGPKSEHIHGFDERAGMASIPNLIKALVLFMAD
ncbi:MAG: hypothetical protein ACP5QR_09455 [Rhizomicrobium sp.]